MDVRLEAKRATELSIAELAAAFNAGFEGYLVPLRFTPEVLAERVVVEAIDLSASFVIVAPEKKMPVGIVLISRRGGRARIAGMGVVPEMRGKKVGRWAIDKAIRDAGVRGERDLLLEVLESNTAARALYDRSGFTAARRLIGHEGRLEHGGAEIERVDPSEVGRLMFAWGVERMPWQVSREAALAWKAPLECFALERNAFAVVNGVDETQVILRAILTAPDRRRRGLARKLLGAISARYGGKRLFFPPLFPEDASPEFFARIGFERTRLSQLEMLRSSVAS